MGIKIDSIAPDEVKDKKGQEDKSILSTKYRKGLKLYAFDISKDEIYEVDIKPKLIARYDEQKQSNYKAEINPKHLHVWALNLKNAHKKFVEIVVNNVSNKIDKTSRDGEVGISLGS